MTTPSIKNTPKATMAASEPTATTAAKPTAATAHSGGETKKAGGAWVDSHWAIPPQLLTGRRDFRICRQVFSVDPPGCQVR